MMSKKQPYFKRMLAIALAAVMLVSQLPISVFAEGAPEVERVTPGDSALVETPEVESAAPEGVLTLGTSVSVEGKTLYAFTPEQSGVYCFYSEHEGESDPHVVLLDADKKLLAEDDDGRGGLDFELNYELTAGTTYYVEADAYSGRFPYKLWVVESELSSIEIVSIPTYVTEEYDVQYGMWTSVYRNEIVDRYFVYYPYTAIREVVLKVNYKDGTSKEISAKDETARGLSYEWDFYNNPWEVGEDNHYYITYKGLKAMANATVTASPVTEIELISAEIPEFVEYDTTNGYWQRYYQDLELDEKYFNYSIEQISESVRLKVTYEDGTIEEVSCYDDEKKNTGIRVYADQLKNHWTVGENEFEIWYRGAYTTATATVVESPVESIRVVKGGDFQFTEFDTNYGYWVNESQGHFYYENNEVMWGVVLEVTNKNGTTEMIEFDYGVGISCEDNQQDVPWTPGGENTLTIIYMGASTAINVTVKPSIVASIAVGDVTVTEGTNGSYWRNETEDSMGHWFHYDIYADDVTVTLTDGTVLKGNQDYIRENVGYSIGFMPEKEQFSEDPWTVGEYVVTASLLGKKAQFKYIIEESNVVSITVNDLELEQYTDGHWERSYYWDPETGENAEVEWFRYMPSNKAQITAEFKDGTTFTGTMYEFERLYGTYPQIPTNQRYDNQWQLGQTYTTQVFLMGKTAEFSVSIVEPNITKIEVIDTQDFVYYENDTSCGEWREDYFRYDPWELARRLTIRVTYKDNTTEEIPYYDQHGNHSGMTYSDNQYQTPWTIGGENLLTIRYQGASTTISAVIEPSPIASIVVDDITHIQNTGGYWENGGYWDENDNWVEGGKFYYYHAYPQNITITYTDGAVVSGTWDDIEKQTGIRPEVNIPQHWQNQWGLGEHTATLTFMGKSAEYSVFIVESDVSSIEVSDIIHMEGTGGWWNQCPPNGEEGEPPYYYYYNCTPEFITIHYKDGTSITGNFNEIEMQTGYYPELIEDQNYRNPWGAGTHTAAISFMGAIGEYEVIITPNNIASIEVETVTTTEYSNGEWHGYHTETGYQQYYYYYVTPGKITIYYTDGTSFTGTPDEIREQTGYSIEVRHDQGSENQWGVGEHTASVVYMGKEVSYTVSIVPTNVESVTASNLTFMEGTGGWWNSYDDGVGNSGYYYHYDCVPEQITVTYKDGTTITGSFDEIEQQTGSRPQLNIDQGPHNQWGVGTHSATVTFMGVSHEIEIVITPTIVASVEVKPVSCYEHTNGDWREYYDQDGRRYEYFYYYINVREVTVTFTDGTSITGTPYEIEQKTGYSYDVISDQDGSNIWGLGTHTVKFAFMGKVADMTVEIVPSPIASITVDKLYLEEGKNGHWCGNEIDGYYFEYYDIRPQKITIYYTDGTELTGSYDELHSQLEGQLSSNFSDGDYFPWNVGTHTAEITCLGTTVEYEIVVTPTRIESISVAPVISEVGQDGCQNTNYYDEQLDSWVAGEWFEYRYYPEMITVTFTDGETFTGTYEQLRELGYEVRVISDQSYFNQWGVGAHPVTMIGAGFQITYTLEVVERVETEEYDYGVLSDGTIVLFACRSYFTDMIIPETIDGYAVSVLASNLFWYSSMESVTIPATVKRIEMNAFYHNENLETVRLNAGLEWICLDAFEGCHNLSKVIYYGTSEQAEDIVIFAGNEYLQNAQWCYPSECTEHEYDDVCDAECNICYAMREPEHAYEWVIDYAGDCLNDGYKHEECTLCHETRNHDTVIPADGTHDNTGLINAKEATCNAWGYTGDLYCYDCNCVIEVGEAIERTNDHKNVEVSNASEATCTQDGYTGNKYCFDCYSTVEYGEVIPAKGHINTELVNVREATCGNRGYTGDTYCHDCNSTIKWGEEVIAKEHINTETVGASEATCGKSGYTGDTYCNACQTLVTKGEIIPAKEHMNTERIGGYAATCGTNGYTGDLYCNDCESIVEYGEEIPASGSHGSLTIIGAASATCNQAGYTGDVSCKVCKTVVEKGEQIPATGKHMYDNGYDKDCNQCGATREVSLEPAKLSMNGGIAYQGDTLRVDVSIEGNTGFAGLQFGVLFDNTYLTLKNVETQMEGFYVTVGNSIVFDAIENHTSDGVIATLIFEIAEDAPVGEYAVQLRFMSGSTEDFEAVMMTGSATTIKVESAVVGDVNGDGRVDTIDLVMLRKYLASMDPITKVSEIAVKKGADANEDGVVDAIDLAFVRQYLASMSAS